MWLSGFCLVTLWFESEWTLAEGVRGHSFSLTFPSSIPPYLLLPSIAPIYIIPQQCPQSSPSISEHLQALH